MGTKKLGQLSVLFGLTLGVALFGSAILSEARAHGPRSIQEKCEGLNKIQKVLFGIRKCTWTVPPAPQVPYARFFGCNNCARAIYDDAAVLLNAADLEEIPTTWVLTVPENYNGRVVIRVPPGAMDHNFVQPVHGILRDEGFAFGSMNHPGPGYPLFPYEDFIDSFRTSDLRDEYFITGYRLRFLVSALFGSPQGFYAYGVSRGAFAGVGLLLDELFSPFDGYVMGSGGGGLLPYAYSLIDAYLHGTIVLTGLTPLEGTAIDKVYAILAEVQVADPEYRDFILSGETDEEKLDRALAYDASTRPRSVRRSWSELALGARIMRPTIIFHGLHDRAVYPGDTLAYNERIIEAGHDPLLRVYLIKDMGHAPFDPPAPPQPFLADLVRKLDAWVQEGTEPGEVDGGMFGPLESCATLGYGEDPLGCFCAEMGDVDFQGQPIPECNEGLTIL